MRSFAAVALRAGLDEANEWTSTTWMCGEDWLDMQAAVRAAFILATKNIDFLDRVPYLLAKLGEDGIKAKCLAQYNSCAPIRHHRVTLEFLAVGSPLREDIDKMGEDGSGMSARLKAEVDSLAAIPMDDSRAEAPHAAANRIMRHSGASKWPWVASTMRLAQNLQDIERIPKATGADLQSIWANYSSIMRGPSSRLPGRPLKKKPRTIQREVYHMSFASELVPEVPQPPVEPGDDGNDGGDEGGDFGGGPGGSALVGKSGQRLLKRLRADIDDLGGDGGGQGRRGPWPQAGSSTDKPKGNAARRHSEEVRLMKEFLSASFKVNEYYSIPVPGEEEGGIADLFFQVLAMESRPVIISTFTTEADEERGMGLYTLIVQVCERWRPQSPLANIAPGVAEEVFVLRDPEDMDVLGICSGATDRRRWYRWTAQQSEVLGCYSLQAHEVLSPNIALADKKIPVLCLLDALDALKCKGQERQVTHKSPKGRDYDCRHVTSKRCYFQCVLAFGELYRVGVKSMPSGQPNAFYALLLKTRAPVPTNLGAAEYNKRMAATETDDTLALETLAHQPRVPARVVVGIGRHAQAVAADDDSIAGDSGVERASPQRMEDVEAGADDETSGSGGEIAADALVLMPGGEGRPLEILGQPLRRIKGRAGGGHWSYFARVSAECNNPTHHRCSKSRSEELGKADFGMLAPVFYLGAWLNKSALPESEHKSYRPTDGEVLNFADGYRRGAYR